MESIVYVGMDVHKATYSRRRQLFVGLTCKLLLECFFNLQLMCDTVLPAAMFPTSEFYKRCLRRL